MKICTPRHAAPRQVPGLRWHVKSIKINYCHILPVPCTVAHAMAFRRSRIPCFALCFPHPITVTCNPMQGATVVGRCSVIMCRWEPFRQWCGRATLHLTGLQSNTLVLCSCAVGLRVTPFFLCTNLAFASRQMLPIIGALLMATIASASGDVVQCFPSLGVTGLENCPELKSDEGARSNSIVEKLLAAKADMLRQVSTIRSNDEAIIGGNSSLGREAFVDLLRSDFLKAVTYLITSLRPAQRREGVFSRTVSFLCAFTTPAHLVSCDGAFLAMVDCRHFPTWLARSPACLRVADEITYTSFDFFLASFLLFSRQAHRFLSRFLLHGVLL